MIQLLYYILNDSGPNPMTVFLSQAARAWWHAEPYNASAHYVAALLALQSAVSDGLPGSFRRALAAARSALSIAERQLSPVRPNYSQPVALRFSKP